MKKLISDPNVKELIKQFDLECPKLYNILIDKFELLDGKILINSAQVLDDDMNFIRFANLSKLIDNLHLCNIIFKNAREQNPSKAD